MRSFLAFAALLAVLALIIPFGAALALPGSLPAGPVRRVPNGAAAGVLGESVRLRPRLRLGRRRRNGFIRPGLWHVRHGGVRFIRFGAVLDGGQGNRQLSCL